MVPALKEKDLVPDALFDPRELKKILDPKSKEKSLYYKAILQNLFFATLNTEMGDKRTLPRIEADRKPEQATTSSTTCSATSAASPIPRPHLKDVFDPIPFLNGGSFEMPWTRRWRRAS